MRAGEMILVHTSEDIYVKAEQLLLQYYSCIISYYCLFTHSEKPPTTRNPRPTHRRFPIFGWTKSNVFLDFAGEGREIEQFEKCFRLVISRRAAAKLLLFNWAANDFFSSFWGAVGRRWHGVARSAVDRAWETKQQKHPPQHTPLKPIRLFKVLSTRGRQRREMKVFLQHQFFA